MTKRKSRQGQDTPEQRDCADQDEIALRLADVTPQQFLQQINAQRSTSRNAPRRTSGTGSVRARSGWWWFRYRGEPDASGRRREHALRIDRLEAMSYEEARFAADALADELLPLEGIASFWSEWCNTFLDDYVPLMKPGTREVVTSVIKNHLKCAFPRMRLNEIRRLHVQAWASRMSAAGAAPDSVRLRFVTLRKLLRRARENGMTVDVPAPGSIELPQSDRAETPSLTPYTDDDLERLLAAAPEPLSTIIHLCAFANLRIGEVLGLKVEDIDLDGGRLYLSRQANRGRIKRPKTKRSAGEHRLGPALVAKLRAYLASHSRAGFLFPSPRRQGHPLHETGVRKQLNALLEDLGIKIPGRAFHGARRWFGTSGARAGVAPQALQHAMRHHDMRSTQRYIRLDTTDADQAIERVEAEYYRGRKQQVVQLVRRNRAKSSKSE